MKKFLILALLFLTTGTIVNAQVPSYVPTNGLVGWWPFNGNVNDQSIHAYTATTYGSWNYTTDRFGNANSAFNFNSPSRVETNATGMFSRQKISISVWVNTADTSRRYWVTKSNWTNASNEMFSTFQNTFQNTSNNVGISLKNNSNCVAGIGWVNTVLPGNYISPNQWVHYVFVCDSLNVKIYKNAVQIGTTTNVVGLDICNGGQLRFGAWWQSDPAYFKGKLDDIGVWNRDLTQQEITNLYNAPNSSPCVAPVVTVTGNNNICQGASTNLSASCSNFSNLNYAWSPSTGLNTTVGATVTANPSITTTYTVVATNASTACSSTTPVVLTVSNNIPSTIASIQGPTSVQVGATIQLSDSTQGGVWSSSNPNLVTVNSNGMVTGVNPGIDTIWYTISNACGQISTKHKLNINAVNCAFNDSIYPSGPTTLCQGSYVVLQAKTTGNNYTYNWYNNGNYTGHWPYFSNDTIYQSGTYYAIINNGTCSDTSNIITVTVNQTSVPNFNLSASKNTLYCSSDSAILNTNLSSTYTFAWYLNGAPIAGKGLHDSSIVVHQGGYYNVDVSNGGCLRSQANYINNATANLGLIGGTNYLCLANDTAYLQVNPTNASSYQWYLNGNLIVGVNGPNYKTNQVGSYKVIIHIGNCIDTTNNYILNACGFHNCSFNDSIYASLPTTFCQGSYTILNAVSTGSNFTYTWYRNGSQITYWPYFATDTAYQSGTYYAIISNGTCIDTSNVISVTMNQTTIPNFSLSSSKGTTLCLNDTTILNTHLSPLYNYTWYNNGVIIPGVGLHDTSIVVNQGYNYYVTVTNGTCPSSNGILLHFRSPLINPSLSLVSGTNTLCAPTDSANLQVSPTWGYDYQWIYNGTNVANHNWSSWWHAQQPGTYQVIVSAGSCVDTSNAYTINACSATSNCGFNDSIYASGPTTFCSGNSLSISSQVPGNNFHQWFWNGTDITDYLFPWMSNIGVNQSGSYYVVITVGGCSDTSNVINVNVIPPSVPIYTITSSNGTILCANDSTTLDTHLSSQYNFTWYYNSQIINGLNVHDSSIVVRQDGTYSVSVSNNGGCPRTVNAPYIHVAPSNINASLSLNSGINNICLPTDSVLLSAIPNSNNNFIYNYHWIKNGNAFYNASGYYGSYLGTNQPGTYQVIVSAGSCVDTSNVFIVNTCSATNNYNLSVVGNTTWCANDSCILIAPQCSGSSYQWYKNGILLFTTWSNSLTVYQSGYYYVHIINGSCQGSTDTIAVNANYTPLASILPANLNIINYYAAPVQLGGSPSGGTMSGPGLNTNKIFTPSIAGLGNKVIHYQVTDSNGCIAQATKTILVYDTIKCSVTDTTHYYDTLYTAVTDTLKFQVSLTGVNPPSNWHQISVYPNPAHDYLMINFGTNWSAMLNYQFQVHNVAAQLVESGIVTQQMHNCNLNNWTGPGTYTLTIRDSNAQLKTKKIIILQ